MSARADTWHGPGSLVGVMIGLLVAAIPYCVDLDGDWQWGLFIICPVLGVMLTAVPGRARHLGVGLIASVAGMVFGVISLMLVSASFNVGN